MGGPISPHQEPSLRPLEKPRRPPCSQFFYLPNSACCSAARADLEAVLEGGARDAIVSSSQGRAGHRPSVLEVFCASGPAPREAGLGQVQGAGPGPSDARDGRACFNIPGCGRLLAAR